MNEMIKRLQALNKHEFGYYIDRVVSPVREAKMFIAKSVPYTRLPLIKEIFSKIPTIVNKNLDANIAVLYTVEMALYLRYKGFKNITIITAEEDEKIRDLADAYKFHYIVVPLGEECHMKFDVVVGNPPYQECDENGFRPKSHSLWPKFIELGISLLKKGGYLVLITPTSWMSPNNKIFRLFKDYDLRWVITDVSYHFQVATTASVWCLCNGSYQKTTYINDDMTVDITEVPYLVGGKSLSIHKKVSFDHRHKIGVAQDTTTAHSSYTKKKPDRLAKKESETHRYPIWHTNRQVLWSSVEPKCLSMKKVVFTTSGYFRPFYDQGTYGVTETSFFIPVKSDVMGRNLLSYLNSKLVRFIVSDAKWSGYLNWNVLKALPKVDLTRSWTDEELYEHFNLTDEEIKLIEDTVK